MDRQSPHDFAAAMAHAQQQSPYGYLPQQYPPLPPHGNPPFLNPNPHQHQFPFQPQIPPAHLHPPHLSLLHMHPPSLSPPFPPHLMPPPIAAPPADPELHKCIDKLAEYVAKNGPEFEDMIRDKQHDNPVYSFLFGGEGHNYYRYRLWLCSISQGPPFDSAYTSPIAVGRPQLPQFPPIGHSLAPIGYDHGGTSFKSSLVGLPADVAAELSGVLNGLTGTKESIKGAKNWFMQRAHFGAALAEALKERMFLLEDSERQMHIVFLANDILFDSLQRRHVPQELDSVALAFKPVLGALLGRIYCNPQNRESNRSRLEKILQFWASKEVFDQDTIRSLEEEMIRAGLTESSSTILPESSVAGLGLPRGTLSTSEDLSKTLLQQPHLAATLPPPLPPAVATVAAMAAPPYPLFPPGLIPGMVKKMQVGSGVPYSPISPLDIPTMIPPSTASPSETLDRVNRFFKEIGEVNPNNDGGASGGEDYGEWERSAEVASRKGGACIPPPAVLMIGEVDDDSAMERRGGGSGRLGLGAAGELNEASQYDDVYSSYRKQRSTNYHSSMSARSSSGR